jgi:hypothetical protein
MKLYQEDLRNWAHELADDHQQKKQSEKDRKKWTMKQVDTLAENIDECTLPELEKLCKKKGILIWAVKYYNPHLFEACIKKSRNCAMQDIIEEIGIVEWCSPHKLRRCIKQKNEEYTLDTHHIEISIDNLEEYDPVWFNTVFSNRYVTLTDIIEKDDNPPRYRKVLD